MTRKSSIVITSWDDGDILDLELSRMLRSYNIRGTFYIPLACGPCHEILNESDVKNLARSFEIGAHTLNHVYLDEVPLSEAFREIVEGKKALQEILNDEVNVFSYPGGRYNGRIINLVKQSGFIGARTTESFHTQAPRDCYRLWTTLHAHPYSLQKSLGNILRHRSYTNLSGTSLACGNIGKSWISLAKAYFDRVRLNGGVFHLWGHSWEIERLGLWNDLEDILAYISANKNVDYLTTGELLKTIRAK
jgi:peptidoglycan-N-acetylglucosamine deacetylase